MNYGKKIMKNMKYIFGIAFVCVMLFTTCFDNIYDLCPPVENGYGKVSINIVANKVDIQQQQQVRTVMPSMDFDKYKFIFTKAGEGTGVEITPDNSGYFTLEVGNYTVKVFAYKGDEEPYLLAASGESQEFTVTQGNNASVMIFLSEVDEAAQGEFTYTITYPEESMAVFKLEKWPSLDEILLNPVDVPSENGKTQTLKLNSGSYIFTVLISKNGLYAGINETVHISPYLLTTYTKEYDDSNLLDKLPGENVSTPTLNTITSNSITINPVIPPDNGQNVEYGIKTNYTASYTWQNDLTFSISGDNIYYISARSAESYNHNAGEASTSLQLIIVTTTTEWNTALTVVREGGNGTSSNPKSYVIYISENIEVSRNDNSYDFGTVQYIEVTISGDKTISLVTGSSYRLLNIRSNQTVIMRDVNFNGSVYFNGTLIMQGSASVYGSSNAIGVHGSNGTFLMQDYASVHDNINTNDPQGGGVYLADCTFIMRDNASVYGNTVSNINGGGVYVFNSTFTMQGNASVHGNTASHSSYGGYGGGVYVFNSTFTMEDNTSVYGNTVSKYGGGVYLTTSNNGSAIFTMQDNASVYGNTANNNNGCGGGVYLDTSFDNGSAIFTMQDNASVYGNTANYGGGVYVGPYSTFIMQGGTIFGNTATDGAGGGVFVYGFFTKTGNSIITGWGNDTVNGNVVKDSSGLNIYGHAVYAVRNAGAPKRKELTAGEGVYMSFNNGSTYSGSWDY